MTSSNPPRSVRLTCVGGDLSTWDSAFRRLEEDSPLFCRSRFFVDVDVGADALSPFASVGVCVFEPVFHMLTRLLLRLLDS